MTTVWKFKLTLNRDGLSLTLPEGSKILSVHEQRGDICLWVQVDTEVKIHQRRSFEVYGTGHLIPEGDRTFLGSVFMDGGAFVFHVFEKLTAKSQEPVIATETLADDNYIERAPTHKIPQRYPAGTAEVQYWQLTQKGQQHIADVGAADATAPIKAQKQEVCLGSK